MNFIYITDTGADLNPKYYKEMGLEHPLELDCTIGDITTGYIPVEDSEYTAFYDKMRNGAVPKTSMMNSLYLRERLEPYLKAGKDVLYLSLSSSLSGSYDGATILFAELQKEYPERKIIVSDSLSASRGQGLLFDAGLEIAKKGGTIEEVAKFIEDNKLKLVLNFTVDDLVYLHRGGRVSKLAAVFGGMLKIKPVMHMNIEGKLVPYTKAKGRKKSIKTMVESIAKQCAISGATRAYICHGDCIDDAKILSEEFTKATGITDVTIDFCGVVIGSHAGPGVLAIFAFGESRLID